MKLNKAEQFILLIALLILCLSCIPRFYDILKFLPDYSIDENDLVESAVGFLGGDLDPNWYRYGPLYAYILALIYSMQALFAGGALDDYAVNVFFNPTAFYYTARLVNSLLNVVLACLAYTIARAVFRKRVAVLVLLLSVFPFFDLLVDFKVRVDTLLAIWSSLCLYFCLNIARTGKLKNYVYAGACFGLSLATKPLPALLILPTIFLAHLLSAPFENQVSAGATSKPEWSRVNTIRGFKFLFHYKLYICLLTGIGFNFIFHPYSFINFGSYLDQQVRIVLHDGGRSFAPGWELSRFSEILGVWFTVLGVLAIAYGLYKGLAKKDAMLLILVSYPIVLWLAFAKGAARAYFYVPIMPVIIVLIAKFIDDLCARIPQNWLKQFLQVTLLVLVLFQPAKQLLQTSLEMNRVEDYTKIHSALSGKKWIEEHIPVSSRIVLYGYYVSLPRLVDNDVTQQAVLGEYFMYYRIYNDYLKTLFARAFSEYLEEGHKTYYLVNLKKHLKEEERRLFAYCKQKKINYVVSLYNLSNHPEFKGKLLKSFAAPEYPFGSNLWIYKTGLP